MTLPTLFVSHGAPTFALEGGRMGPLLATLAEILPQPHAIVMVSAHWETPGIEVTSNENPHTVHDFGGFPAPLYALQYTAPGSPTLAAKIIDLLAAAGLPARGNLARGFDHGAWVPLLHLYPEAKVPVLQFSLPRTASPQVLWQIGEALQGLREEGVLLIASGGITHNLGEFRMGTEDEAPYARAFMEWFAQAIADGARDDLVEYRLRAPAATRAHPTDEHLRPIFVALGAAGGNWSSAQRLDGGIDFGVIGMDAYAFGLSPELQQGLSQLGRSAQFQTGEFA